MGFNQIMSKLFFVLLIIFIVSIATFSIYTNHLIDSSSYTSKDIFDVSKNDININLNIDDFDNSSMNVFEDSNTFDLVENLRIDCTVEDILFIYEDRNNIQIDYYHEKPTSSAYRINYECTSKDNTIYIYSNLSINNIHNYSNYNKIIKIHVPIDYKFTNYELSKNFGIVTSDCVPENAENVTFSVDAGDTTINLKSEINQFIFNGNAGSISITNYGVINEMSIDCDLGDIQLDSHESIDKLHINTNAGSLEISSYKPINQINVESDLGSVTGTFHDEVNYLTVASSASDIQMTFYENNDTNVYANVNFGSIESDLTIVSRSEEPPFVITSDLGSINITSK